MRHLSIVVALAMLLAACLPVAGQCEWSSGGYWIDWQPKKAHLAIEFEVSDLECE